MTLDARTIEKLAKVGLTVMRRDAHAPSSTVPLFIAKVAAGMPSLADDYVEKTLDLNEYCLPHSEASFFLKVSGNSMSGAAIHDAHYDPVDRNWIMAAYDPTGKVLAYGKVGSCIACHVLVRHQDLVFAPPPTQLLPITTWKAFFSKQEMNPAYVALIQKNPGAVVQ
ncbi:S24 family peptidase [Acidithiobacillus concretivorus]|uniref:S24 family peptidase n=1 Tax=Acidithiobacillus concretivorus TaxID=3063952 RepID=UPI001D01BDCF|nr:S24 family peptidase [Acidithiobacillus concretivorus]